MSQIVLIVAGTLFLAIVVTLLVMVAPKPRVDVQQIVKQRDADRSFSERESSEDEPTSSAPKRPR